ncbi:MAG: glycerol kinase GlpK [Lachnospiraceae bacterium]|nr:glycerol kinase GlpK [Lachnospiraceae bacterium]
MKYIMALDQGTTSSRAILFDHSGEIRSVAQEEFAQIYPKPGWVEHDPRDIWRGQLEVARKAMKQIGAKAEDIAAIGVTNQRETTIVWDKTNGQAVYNAIVWQCRRTAPMIDKLVAEGLSAKIRSKTGLIPDAYFSASKLAWILDNVEGARERAEKGELLFGTVDSWLIWNLTGGKAHVTDVTNASRTMLYDIHHRCWDQELLDLFRIPACMLPEVRPSSCIYGTTSEYWFGGEIPVAGAAGDQQAALFGQCCFKPGEVKSTYGTGGFMLMNTGKKAVTSKSGLLTTIAIGISEEVEYALEGSVFVSGAVVQWLRDELKLVDASPDSEYFATKVKDTGGVYLVPAFTGLGAPYWNQYARGMMVGLTRSTTKAQMIRAALEAIAYQTMDVCTAMEKDSGISLKSIQVDGGASRNDFLMQFQSDVLGSVVCRPKCVETTALGAAFLAGLAVGFWRDKEEVKHFWNMDKVFMPTMTERERQKAIAGWHLAVDCALRWGEMERKLQENE